MHPMLLTLETHVAEKLVVLRFKGPLAALALDYRECLMLGEQLLRRAEDIKPDDATQEMTDAAHICEG
jgi:hypothetical protein